MAANRSAAKPAASPSPSSPFPSHPPGFNIHAIIRRRSRIACSRGMGEGVEGRGGGRSMTVSPLPPPQPSRLRLARRRSSSPHHVGHHTNDAECLHPCHSSPPPHSSTIRSSCYRGHRRRSRGKERARSGSLGPLALDEAINYRTLRTINQPLIAP